MKTFASIIALLCLTACNRPQKAIGFVYYMDIAVLSTNSFEKGEQAQTRKFFSYKNCLFELVPDVNTVTSVNKEGMVRENEIQYFVNVMPAGKNMVYQIDAFKKGFSLVQKTSFEEKQSGLLFSAPNINYPKLLNAVTYRNREDTIINNQKFLVTDSSFLMNDTMPVKNFYFFIQSPPIHTIYSINFANKPATQYQFAGIKTEHRGQTISRYSISGIGYMTEEETAVCEKIIAKLQL